MAIKIRNADLDADRDLLVDMLRRNVNPHYDQPRFDWAYHHNPFGKARAWIAGNGRGEVVGVAAAFPRGLVVGTTVELGWLLADFCISEHYRSLGPALQLQRACLAEACRAGIRFCYDAPSPSMMVVHTRLGLSSTRRMVRLARPLKIDQHVRRWLGSRATRMVAPIINVMLALDARMRGGRGDVTVDRHEGPCGPEFTDLAGQAQPGIHIERSAAYVTWRYLDTPVRKHEILVARRGGVLQGYLAFSVVADQARVVDLFVADGGSAARPLVRSLLRLLRERDVATISVPLLDTHPHLTVLEHCGFRRREAAPIVTIGPPDIDMPWILTYGDLDV